MNFCAYLESYEPEILTNFDSKFSKFLKENLETSQNLNDIRFFGGDFLMSFAFHTLVRTFEFIQDHREEINLDDFFNEIEANFDFYRVLYESNLEVRVPDEDEIYNKGFQKFIRKLRNAISHSRFYHPDSYSIGLFNIAFSGQKNFEVIFKYDAFLNFCKEFFDKVNNTLISQGLLKTK